MGAKEELLASFTRRDTRIQIVHDALVAINLKFKGPSNSQTLLYYFRVDGEEFGVAAMRCNPSAVFSFPAAFWHHRPTVLSQALSRVSSFNQKEVQPAISSSQYSAGQIYINGSTLPVILQIIHEIVVPAAQSSGADLRAVNAVRPTHT
jgi:hypothetical protein